MPRFRDSKTDPYRNFNFRIFLGNTREPVAACKKMSKLSAAIDVVKFRSGNSPSSVTELMPGRLNYDPITLEAGLTNDKTFQDWATALMKNERQGARPTDPDFRRNVGIKLYDLDNQTPVREYTLIQAWVSKYTAVSDLAGDANDILIESIEIQHEGFIREDHNEV
jgi:phage tail-like protein